MVFLSTCLMQRVDTESNPGPDTRNNWERAGDYLRADTKTRDLRQRSSTDTDRTPHDTASYTLGDTVLKMQSFQAQMVECMSRCLQQVDENQTVLSDNIHLLNKWFRSLQSQNDQLREDIEYLLTKCKALERPCRQFFAGQSDMFQTTRDLVDQTDKLHSPCTNRPHTSPRDGLASAQPHPSTAPPHQLDSSTPAESLGDLERQPTLGHPKKTTEANSMACTGAGEAGKEVSQLSSPLQVSSEDRHSSQTALHALVHKVQRSVLQTSLLRDRDSAGPLLKCLHLKCVC